jgi:putative ATPase
LTAFRLAAQRHCVSVAVPAISSGIFRFPKDECAKVLVGAAWDFFEEHPVESLQEIRFTIIDDETVSHFRAEFVRRFGADCLHE